MARLGLSPWPDDVDTQTETFYPLWPESFDTRSYTPYVQNIAIISGNAATIACPPYFGKIDLDLNQFAGGPYIFICYGKSDSIRDTQGAIEGVTVEAVSLENPLAQTQGCRSVVNGSCVSHFVNAIQPSNGDLNQGAGGEYIYLGKTVRPCINGACDPGASPKRYRLRELAVVAGPTLDILCPSSYTKIPIDLNQGARGSHIFLCQMVKIESEFD